MGIYVGNGKMVEAVDEAHGVCLGNYHNGGLVMICRPGKYSKFVYYANVMIKIKKENQQH